MSDDFTPISEAEVVEPLMRFPSFARYYREQRPRIERVGPLAWGIRPGHHSSGSNSAIPLENEQGQQADGWLILLRERPRTLRYAHTVAHELHHSILDIEGWPRVRCEMTDDPNMRHLAIGIGGLLDPMVERALARYGFAGDPQQSMAATAYILGGQHTGLNLLRVLEATDLTDKTAVTKLMRQMCGPSRGQLRVVFRGQPCQ